MSVQSDIYPIHLNCTYQMQDLRRKIRSGATYKDLETASTIIWYASQTAGQDRLRPDFSEFAVQNVDVVETEAMMILAEDSQRRMPTLETAAFILYYRILLDLRKQLENRDGNVWPRPIDTAGEA